ncbi:MAG: hypothetical protein NVSMB26_24480 [Beijerinckiaceae bacterium]
MYTLGYSFRPWREVRAIADGPSILKYIRETAQEYGVARSPPPGHLSLILPCAARDEGEAEPEERKQP